MKAIVLVLALTAGCVDSTGGAVVSFDVAAAGPADVTGHTRAIDNGLGWHVALTTATLHVGAVYLNLSVPNSGAQATDCILPGIYTAEELHGADVDLLDAAPQPFAAPGTGTDDLARTGEVWLTGGDVNASTDTTVITQLVGTASKGATVTPFTATVTIGANRLIPSTDPSQPSLHPICKQRIVTPISIDLQPRDGGTLLLRVDPAAWFADVDFTSVAGAIPDDDSTPAGQNLFTGLRSVATYQLSFQ